MSKSGRPQKYKNEHVLKQFKLDLKENDLLVNGQERYEYLFNSKLSETEFIRHCVITMCEGYMKLNSKQTNFFQSTDL